MNDENTNQEELTELKNQLEQMTELAKRTMADMQNYKRRQEEERRMIVTIANSQFVSGLLPILDNLERASSHKPDAETLPEEAKEWAKGLEISINQLQKFVEEVGVKKIESLGEKFDPNLHEALVYGPGEKDLIVEELEKGYTLGDKIIRHAKVKVGNGEKQ